jgi:hypothetical protein
VSGSKPGRIRSLFEIVIWEVAGSALSNALNPTVRATLTCMFVVRLRGKLGGQSQGRNKL